MFASLKTLRGLNAGRWYTYTHTHSLFSRKGGYRGNHSIIGRGGKGVKRDDDISGCCIVIMGGGREDYNIYNGKALRGMEKIKMGM